MNADQLELHRILILASEDNEKKSRIIRDQIKSCYLEYSSVNYDYTPNGFRYWLEYTYGIRDTGSKYIIVDDKKYLIFILKYGFN